MKAFAIAKSIGIRTKINLILGTFFLFVLASLFVLYQNQVSKTFSDTHASMSESLLDITKMMQIVENLTDSGFTAKDYNILKPFFQDKKFYETGYPFLVSKSGDFLIHPKKEGTNEFESPNHVKRLSYGEGSGYFRYIFSSDSRTKWQYVRYFKLYNAYVTVTFYEDELFGHLSKFKSIFYLIIALAVIIFFSGTFIIINPIVNAINSVNIGIGNVAKGKIIDSIKIRRNDEIGEMTKSVNALIDEVARKTHFSNEIAKGNLAADYQLSNDEDILGKSLLNMRDSIVKASNESNARNKEIEEQNWNSEGLAKFGEILRTSNTSMEDFGYSIISSLVKYINASQGGLFTVNSEDPTNLCLDLLACYAFDRRKYLEKTIAIGEGLVGQCVVEKETIILSEVPEDYMKITSGLGKSSPRYLIIVPLKTNGDVLGAIELASFNPFEPHIIQFVEKIGESIASTISSVKIGIRTAQLLEKSQSQAEQMLSQEEELRQNMEEMHATQEEMTRREKEQKDEIARLQDEKEQLQIKLKALENK